MSSPARPKSPATTAGRRGSLPTSYDHSKDAKDATHAAAPSASSPKATAPMRGSIRRSKTDKEGKGTDKRRGSVPGGALQKVKGGGKGGKGSAVPPPADEPTAPTAGGTDGGEPTLIEQIKAEDFAYQS